MHLGLGFLFRLGIRAGKSADRKRKVYQAYQLALQPYRYNSAEEVSMVHQDRSSRPLYTPPGWKPDFESDEGEEEQYLLDRFPLFAGCSVSHLLLLHLLFVFHLLQPLLLCRSLLRYLKLLLLPHQ